MRKLCSIVLATCLSPLPSFAETPEAAPASSTTEPPAHASRLVDFANRLRAEVRVRPVEQMEGVKDLAARGLQPKLYYRAPRAIHNFSPKNKWVAIAGGAAVAAGIALSATAYEYETYNACPGLIVICYRTRSTLIDSQYWAGTAVTIGGGVLIWYGLFNLRPIKKD